MNMRLLTAAVTRLPEFQPLLEALKEGRCPVALSGAAVVHRTHIAAALGRTEKRPVILVCADEAEATRIARDLEAFTQQSVSILSSRAFTFHQTDTASRPWEHRRLALLWKLHRKELPYLVVTIEGLLQATLPPSVLAESSIVLKPGECVAIEALLNRLIAAGYTRCDQVEGVGQFAQRGGILDVFSPGMERPTRLEWFGDDIDTIGIFDPTTQRRTENLEEVVLLPAREVLPHKAPEGRSGLSKTLGSLAAHALQNQRKGLAAVLEQDRERLQEGDFPGADRYLPLIYPMLTTAMEYLPQDAYVLFSECGRVMERARTYQWQLEEDIKTLLEREELDSSCAVFAQTFAQLCQRLEKRAVVYLDSFLMTSYPTPPKTLLSITALQSSTFGFPLETTIQDLEHYQKIGYAVVLLVGGEQRALELQTLLREHKIKSAVEFQLKQFPEPGQIRITLGGLSGGIDYPALKLAVLTEGVRGTPRRIRSKSSKAEGKKLGSYGDLSPGDLVVHEQYGVGRFLDMVKMEVDGVDMDYLKIAYAGTDVLYISAAELDSISKYIGAGGDGAATKKLSRLGGADWEKAKSKARKAVQDLAKGLIQLYAQRQRQPGFAFSPDSPWQREFEEQFEYHETEDQLRCIAEIKQDMEREIPMDRLLCGDVGYGKTEVAFRAIMKCVLDGKQAAILAPTTVLARQHYLTALKRFARYPVNVDVVSRFRTPKQMKDTLRRVAMGQIDILIGTHRLFHKDVEFKDLGLLVVDEEQRFGVQHKERLKEKFRQVDVLTLSATPIPRTLNMALSGIRDMSTLEEPPANRQPVQTYVLEHDWGVLGDAMRRELERGGQVYYLHNRVESIDRCAAHLQRLLGESVSIGVAHGKMSQQAIDQVMSQMTDGELNILVCTTIIETGIDLPNANTLIIEDADQLGLAQLHQLRGRVGRSSRRAFAYLTYRRGKVLSEVSTKRLSAIREFAEFGSGFKIAMRDLEIRGAGNVLGAEQSGFMLSVGYDMYLRLLEEAVLTEQGKPLPKKTECSINLPVAASIPEYYIPSLEQRIDLYRRVAAIRSEEDADDLVDELIDRYGEPPRTVNNLITVSLVRTLSAQAGITELCLQQGKLILKTPAFDLEQISQLCAHEKYQNRLVFSASGEPHLSIEIKKGEQALRVAQDLVRRYAPLNHG